jgi:hypothetical protein
MKISTASLLFMTLPLGSALLRGDSKRSDNGDSTIIRQLKNIMDMGGGGMDGGMGGGGGNSCSTSTCSIDSDCCTGYPCESGQCVVVVFVFEGLYEVKTATDLPPPNADAAAGNPFKGFLTSPLWVDYQYQQTNIPTSLDFYYLGLDTTMTGDNTFDWTYVNGLLEQSASQSRHAILRFILDYPNQATYVPQYLIDGGLTMTTYTDFGGGQSPDYSDSGLLTALQQFITAFGQQLDGHPHLAFVQVGLLGFWGEWHTWPHEDWIPATTKDLVVQWFDAAFSTTPLQTRTPWSAAVAAGFGLHDDSFAYSTLSDDPALAWFFWPQVQGAGHADFWQSNVMGGELRPELQSIAFSGDYPDGTAYQQDFDLCVDTTHATYMLNHYACSNDGYSGQDLTKAQDSNNRMGYQFVVTQVVAFATAGDDSVVDIDVEISQTGVAPFYYPLSLALSCSAGSWELSGVETIIGQGSFGFTGIPATTSCLGSMDISLVSVHAYAANPVKFAQGTDGTVVQVSFGFLP